MLEMVKSHDSNTFWMGSCLMCSWEKPWVFLRCSPCSPLFTTLLSLALKEHFALQEHYALGGGQQNKKLDFQLAPYFPPFT